MGFQSTSESDAYHPVSVEHAPVGNQETASTVGGADRTKQEHLRSIRGIIQEEIEPQFEDRLGRQQARRLC